MFVVIVVPEILSVARRWMLYSDIGEVVIVVAILVRWLWFILNCLWCGGL